MPDAENGLREHPHIEAVRAYLDNAGITPETLRYAATHEALCQVVDLRPADRAG